MSIVRGEVHKSGGWSDSSHDSLDRPTLCPEDVERLLLGVSIAKGEGRRFPRENVAVDAVDIFFTIDRRKSRSPSN